MRRPAMWLGIAGVVIGIVSEPIAFGWSDPGRWVPDLLTGWVLIACGLFVSIRRPQSTTGTLLAATGFTWFFGNFATAYGVVGWFGSRCVYLHRGPLFHSLIAYPSGRTSSRDARAAVVASYVVAILPEIWNNEPATIVLALSLVAVTAAGYVRSAGPDRFALLIAVRAAAALSAVILAGAIARLVPGGSEVGAIVLLVYEATLCAVALALTVGLISARSERAVVTDLVVGLGEARSGTLRAQLARVLGDPSLEVGYWQPETQAFVDAEGGLLTLPFPGSDRAVTFVEGESHPVAALVHDPVVLRDPVLLEAVTAAARLGVSNSRLQADVRARVMELEASRRRLLHAGDDERRRLEHRLHDGAERRLRDIADILHRSRTSSDAELTAGRVAAAERQVGETLEDLSRLARGLHPRVLAEHGLERALEGLRETYPIPLRIHFPEQRLDAEAELVAYFVCSEALTNIAKHASASRAAISVDIIDRHMKVVVEDDGVGGANLARGSGLRGLADRIETVGGTLRIQSAPGQGTHLTAEIPLGGEVT